jgi:ubiquinone/menaquinone biosynthesis C-methylase UbiE
MSFRINLLRFLKDKLALVSFLRFINRILRNFLRLTHEAQFYAEWLVDHPEYFEHQMDLHYKWHKTRSPHAIERGVFSSFALRNETPPTGKTLDLCSGDGFFSYYFYSIRSESVIAIDFDSSAIEFAKKNYFEAKNIQFIVGDIRKDIPDGPYDNIVWDASIDYFSKEEIQDIMVRIKAVLKTDGTLSGFSVVNPDYGAKHLHKLEIQNESDLIDFFSPFFKNIDVFTTTYPDRKNLYFYASDRELPFKKNSISKD